MVKKTVSTSTAVAKPAAGKKVPAKTPSGSAVKSVVQAEKKASIAPRTNKVAQDTQSVKPAKPKKAKLVRDSFTIPKDEFEVLSILKQRCLAQGHACKKSELLRAGIKALAAMDDARLLAALQLVPSIKTGRPAKA